jgi:hypothetical protein
MDRGDLELITRLAALEYVLTHTVKILFLSADLGVEDLDNLRKRMQEALATQTFPGLPATLSDHFADELAGEVDRILGGIQSELVRILG